MCEGILWHHILFVSYYCVFYVFLSFLIDQISLDKEIIELNGSKIVKNGWNKKIRIKNILCNHPTFVYLSTVWRLTWEKPSVILNLLCIHLAYTVAARNLPESSLHTQDIIPCCDIWPIEALSVAIVTVKKMMGKSVMDKYVE